MSHQKTDLMILKNKVVTPADCLTDWAAFMENFENRRVKQTVLPSGTEISTVFLGMNHGFGGIDRWFETMVFGGSEDGFQARYVTYDEAQLGHETVVSLIKKRESP